MARRLGDHVRAGRLGPLGEATVTEVPGGRFARELAEQARIDELGGINGGIATREILSGQREGGEMLNIRGKLLDTPVGRVLVPYEPWSPQCLHEYDAHDAVGLIANYSWGCDLMDLSVLRSLRNLTFLRSVQPKSVLGFSTLAHHALEYVSNSRGFEERIDLSRFPHLRELVLGERSRLDGLGTLTQLRRLHLVGISKSIWSDLPIASPLEDVSLVKSGITSPRGVERWRMLKIFECTYCSKLSLSGGFDLPPTLEVVSLERCQSIGSVSRIVGPGIESISLVDCGEIDSVLPLLENRSLKRLIVCGSTNVLDGKLRSLSQQPSILKMVVDPIRPHYDASVEELPDYAPDWSPDAYLMRSSNWILNAPPDEVLASIRLLLAREYRRNEPSKGAGD